MPTVDEQQNWSEDVNLAGVAPAGASLEPERTYKMVTRAVVKGLKKDGSGGITFRFEMEVVAPVKFAGRRQFKTMGDPKGNGKAFWRTAFQSHGISPEMLDKGAVSMTPDTFREKHCYLYVGPVQAPKDGQTKGYPDVEFLLPDVGEKNLKREAEQDANGTKPAPAAAPSTPAASSVDQQFAQS